MVMEKKKLIIAIFAGFICCLALVFLIFSGDIDDVDKDVGLKNDEVPVLCDLPVLDSAETDSERSFEGGFYAFFGDSQSELAGKSIPTIFLPEKLGFIPVEEWKDALIKKNGDYNIVSEQDLMDLDRNSAGEQAGISEEPVFMMSDEDYFGKAYPEMYRAILDSLQDFLVDKNFITSGQKIVFKTEEDTYVLFLRIADYAFFKGYIQESMLDNYKKGIEELKKLNVGDRVFVEKRLLGKNIDDLLARAKNIILNLVGTEKAQAFVWVSIGVECYKSAGLGGPLGYNSWAECCNCGEFCSNAGCQYYQDCGYMGASCNVPMGCLNMICGWMSAAIWDPITGICGCG